MDIRHYIAQTERTYHYRIKTVVPLDDKALGRIERCILKYQPLDMSTPRKTLFQRSPLDFPGVENAEVYMVDVELGLPASAYVLQQELRAALGLPEKFIQVRNDTDPLELETEKIDSMKDIDTRAKKDGMVPGALLSQENYEEVIPVDAADHYGNEYNSRFLSYLRSVEKAHADVHKIEPQSPLFKWMDLPKTDADETNYNADIKDAPEVPAKPSAKSVGQDVQGDRNKSPEFRRVFKDKNGTEKVLSVKAGKGK